MNKDDDNLRYRITVMLVASERPKYWRFYCSRCGMSIGAELSGEVIGLSDVADITSIGRYESVPVAVECRRKYCRTVYEFVSLAGR